MSKCTFSPDWSALREHEQQTQSSVDPNQFFGCEVENPYGNAAAGEQLFSVDPSLQVCEEGSLMSEDPSLQVCEDPDWAQAVEQPPAVGLDAYEVVPDDFVGPLGPNQIRQSQRDELDAFDFGGLNVVPNDFAGPLAVGQMRQSDYEALQTAWLNIDQGVGMELSGSAADQEAFKHMLRDSIGTSDVFRELITSIGNDTDPAHRIQADLGRSQPGVLFDSFGTNEIDLDDFDQLNQVPDAAHPNDFTRGEAIAHFLAERQSALASADPTDFDPAHDHGIDVQNAYRAELGQSPVIDQSAAPAATPGNLVGTSTYADGTHNDIEFDGNGNIVNITRP